MPVVRQKCKRSAAILLIGGLSVGCWWTFVASRTAHSRVLPLSAGLDYPARGFLRSAESILQSGRQLHQIAKDVAFLGTFALAIGVGLAIGAHALRQAIRSRVFDETAGAIVAFAMLGLVLSRHVWSEPWAYGRALLPLTTLLLLYGLQETQIGGPRDLLRSFARRVAVSVAALGAAFTLWNLLTGTA